jgi:hypothetical protein
MYIAIISANPEHINQWRAAEQQREASQNAKQKQR